MTDLLLDPAIRTWVFVPIILLTFLIGIIRHYAYILLSSKKKLDPSTQKDGHYLARAQLLRRNGRALPPDSFGMRKSFLADKDTGYFPKRIEETAQADPLDPSVVTEMLKGNMLNMIPMFMIGTWINWVFSGFLITKLPFPLTHRFKSMFQQGIRLTTLDASWVSSASWYFLSMFGLRSIYNLVLGGDNVAEVAMQEQAQRGMSIPGGDAKQAIKSEWEALQVCPHEFQP